MPPPTTIEHNVWTLARLLAPSDRAADAALARVLRAHGDPRRVGESRLYRAAINATRETRSADGLSPSEDAPALAHRLAELPARQREAWVLRRVMELPELEACFAAGLDARPMRTLLDEAGRALGGEAISSGDIDAVRAWTSERSLVGVERARRYASGARTKRRAIAAAQFAAFFAMLALIVFIMLDLAAWDNDRLEEQLIGEQFSNPLPGDEAIDRTEGLRSRPSRSDLPDRGER